MMKNRCASICLFVFCLGLFGCVTGPQWQARHAIDCVLVQKGDASSHCVYYAVDGEDIANLQIHGTTYLQMIKRIDVSACPEPFRQAWADYCQTWAQKLKKEKADEDTLDLISVAKGEVSDLPILRRSLEAYDTKPAWDRCLQVARTYGVSANQ